jgi:ABC-type Na+ efflux pump permease subunit
MRGKTPIVMEIDPAAGYLAGAFTERLQAAGFRFVPADSAGPSVPRLVLPAAFTDSILAGTPVTVTYRREESDLGGDYDQVRVQRAAISLLSDMVLAGRDEGEPTLPALVRAAALPRLVELDVAQAGKRPDPPTGFDQAIPGTMVMFTLLVLFTSGSVLLVIERRQGLLRRLASAPLSRGAILLGKWGSRMALGVVQIAFAMLAGTLLFKVDWGPNLPVLFLVLVVYGGLGAALGMLLGNLARTEGQAVGIGVLTTNIIAPLGGCWWPIEATPEFMQRLALAFPTGWAMNALHKLVSFGEPGTAVIPHLLVMVAATLVVGRAAARTFRFQ